MTPVTTGFGGEASREQAGSSGVNPAFHWTRLRGFVAAAAAGARMPNPSPTRFVAWRRFAYVVVLLSALMAVWWLRPAGDGVSSGPPAPGQTSGTPAADAGSARPALTVTITALRAESWPVELTANGSIEAWQEIVIGSEVSGLRLAEVAVDVGDRVHAGQLLARLDDETVRAGLAQTRAALTEAEAMLAEARANARRAGTLGKGGALSAQQLEQYRTAEQTALARVDVQRARLQTEERRLAWTRIVAPVDGTVAVRAATPGSIVHPGAELFRLIRDGRLEWRAEMPDGPLARIEAGQRAQLITAGGAPVEGRVRIVAPTVDPHTRMGLVYVDLPPTAAVRAGTFARGRIVLDHTPAQTLPQTAVSLRDGFAIVFRVDDDDRVVQTKVRTGRRVGDRVEIVDGLEADARVVETGAGFLVDGDRVHVVAASPAARASP